MFMKKIFVCLFIFLAALRADCQIIDDQNGLLDVVYGSDVRNTLVFTAQMQVNTPYEGNTLNQYKHERLIVNVRSYDCATFVETMVAVAMAANANGRRGDRYVLNEKFRDTLTKLRYHGGAVRGYASRIHYFADWLKEAQKNKIFADVTSDLGGVVFDKPINYMTQNSEKYPKINTPSVLDSLKRYEAALNAARRYYIPKKDVAKIERKLQDGDLIGITSGVLGLDCNHQGFVVMRGKRAHLLHASSEKKKVVLSSEPLADYLNRIEKHTGIIVGRLLN